jgi:hypothetical protein
MARAMYGAEPSVGLRTTSRLVKPAMPNAWLSPPPPALSRSNRTSILRVRRRPVYSVSTRDVAVSASGPKLFGPLYLAENDGLCCVMKLA